MDFKQNQPIYLQIADYVCEQVLLKNWKVGERILSIRELAINLEVNPNTVQRAYDLLQNENIISNKRGVGYFTEEKAIDRIIRFKREQFLHTELPQFFNNLYLLKIDMADINVRFQKFLKENYHEKAD